MCLHLVGKRSLLQGVKKHLFFNARASFTLTGDASYFFLGGEYFSAKEYLGNNQQVLKEIYQHFGMRWTSPETRAKCYRKVREYVLILIQ